MNISSERNPSAGSVARRTFNGRRVKNPEPKSSTQTTLQSSPSSSNHYKRKALKAVVRLLPPALKETDFLTQIKEHVNEATINDFYYVEGSYSEIPFQPPTHSRAYILFKEEVRMIKFMKAVRAMSFQNSKALNEEELFTPIVELSFYDKMDFPQRKKPTKYAVAPLNNDPVFKEFAAWYAQDEASNSRTERPDSFISTVKRAKVAKNSKKIENAKKKAVRLKSKESGKDQNLASKTEKRKLKSESGKSGKSKEKRPEHRRKKDGVSETDKNLKSQGTDLGTNKSESKETSPAPKKGIPKVKSNKSKVSATKANNSKTHHPSKKQKAAINGANNKEVENIKPKVVILKKKMIALRPDANSQHH